MVGVASALALAWAVLVWISGGTTIAVAGLAMSSTDPVRPLVAAVVLAAVYVFLSGRARLATMARMRARSRHRHGWPVARDRRRRHGDLAVVVDRIGRRRVRLCHAGGLVAVRPLKVPVPIANEVPWPAPLSTFVPFGYAAVANESAIASAVGPGLPLLMAVIKAIGGHAALFLVVPITAALLIWCTFAIGRQLGS